MEKEIIYNRPYWKMMADGLLAPVHEFEPDCGIVQRPLGYVKYLHEGIPLSKKRKWMASQLVRTPLRRERLFRFKSWCATSTGCHNWLHWNPAIHCSMLPSIGASSAWLQLGSGMTLFLTVAEPYPRTLSCASACGFTPSISRLCWAWSHRFA